MSRLYSQPLAVVDIETTGASPVRDRVLEIAIIRIEEGNIVQTLHTVIDPQKSVQPTILSLTGITEREITKAPTFATLTQDIQNLLDGAIFVAHNARFDYGFIKNEFGRLGISFSAKCLCTVRLSRLLYPKFKRHDLSTIIERFDFACENRHRALSDAQVLVDFLKHSLETSGEVKYTAAIQKILKKSSTPATISETLIESLPQSPGVYIFYGEEGEKLYIGKSVNIKARVQSHFSGDHSSGKEMRLAQETHDIEYISTSGDLSALLLESHLIKKEQPLYNRLSRYTRKMIVLTEVRDEHGYKRIEMNQCIPEELPVSEKIVGLFRSQQQAKKILNEYAQTYELCPLLLGLEKGSNGCFYVQLGKCKGACLLKENVADYNQRFDKAFEDRRIKSWPYQGPILITEHTSFSKNEGSGFVIDNWCLTKSFIFDEAGIKDFLPESAAFDYDAYKILSSSITRPKNLAIRELSQAEALHMMNKEVAIDLY